MNLRKNIFFKILIIAGIALFVVVSVIIVNATSTVVAIVPNQSIKSGTVITSDMVKTISISSNVPKGYITDKSSVIGQKLRIGVEENQLLYINNIMTSWEELIEGQDIPDNYIITSILIPSERAIGGLITAGDTVDIFGLPNKYYSNTTWQEMESYLGQMGKYDSYGADGIHGYWVAANVKILETDSTLSSIENSSIATITGSEDENEGGAYYIVAVSYSDYQKLRLSEEYLNLWLNLVPKQNEENDPLYDQMRQSVVKMMQDSQNQPEDYLLYGKDDLEEDPDDVKDDKIKAMDQKDENDDTSDEKTSEEELIDGLNDAVKNLNEELNDSN